MKRQQTGVLLAGLLALSQLAACSSIGWKGFGSSPMPAASSPSAATAPASTPAPASVTASAGDKGNASGSGSTGQN